MASANAGRFGNCSKIIQVLSLNRFLGLEKGANCSGDVPAAKDSRRRVFHKGAIFRSFRVLPKSDGRDSSYEQAQSFCRCSSLKYRSVAATDLNGLNASPSVGKFGVVSHFKYWAPSWLSENLLSVESNEILSRSKSCRIRFNLAHIDQQRLQNSYRRNYKIGQKSSSFDAVVKYVVTRIDCDGSLQHQELKSSELGLHPRDVDLLSNSTFIPQRATIAVQRDKVLVRMENVRAIVCKDYMLLFDARQPRNSVDGELASQVPAVESSHSRGRDAFAKALAQQVKDMSSDLLDPTPFHLRVVESLLEETSNFFHQKVDRLAFVVELMLQELTDDVSMGGLRRLLPLRRAVTELEHDVRDAHEAMDQIVRSDEILQALCLLHEGVTCSPNPQGPQMLDEKDEHVYNLRQATADMLLTYQREVDDAGGVLEELRKGMEAAQEVWELGLDTTRNRIIRMNLYISISTCSIAFATVPAALFGMNLRSGYEEHPTLFFWVLGAACTVPLCIWLGFGMVFQLWPRMVDKRRAQDLAGLLDLLRHLDSIDDIIGSVASGGAGKVVTPKEFRKILRSHTSSQFMRQRELDLLFRMLDTNRNGVLDEVKGSNSGPSR